MRQLPKLPPPEYLDLLGKIGKRETYDEVRKRALWIAPFEMREQLNPAEMGAAVEARLARWVPTLEGFRNALVVVPLMLTWFALGLAAAAYQQYTQALFASVKKPSAAPAPLSFFQEWQLGFPELTKVHVLSWQVPLTYHGSHFFTFADVGFLDFSILLLLLVLTVLAQWIEARAYRKGVRFATWFDNHLFAMMKVSHLFSADPTQEGKPPWLTAMEEAVLRLSSTVDGVAGVQEAAAKLTGIYEEVRPIYKTLEMTLPAMKDNASQLVDAQEGWQQLGRNLAIVARILADLAGPSAQQELRGIAYPRPVARPSWGQRITTRLSAPFRRSGASGGR